MCLTLLSDNLGSSSFRTHSNRQMSIMEDIENDTINSSTDPLTDGHSNSQNSNDEREYLVEEILDKKIIDGVCKYKIKWKNYPLEDCTWEPIEHLANSQNLLWDFEESISQQKQDRRRAAKEVEEINFQADLKEFQADLSQKKGILNAGAGEIMGIEIEGEVTQNEMKAITENAKKTTEKRKHRERKSFSIEGSLECKDLPRQVLSVKPVKRTGKVIFEIDWYQRANGLIPLPSLVSNIDLRKYNPQFLLDYYESKISFIPKKKHSATRNSNEARNNNSNTITIDDDAINFDSNLLRENFQPE